MMKKLIPILAAALIIFTGCSEKKLQAQILENPDASVSITRIDEDGKAILFNKKIEGSKNVTQVKAALTSRANPVTVDLSAFEGKDLDKLALTTDAKRIYDLKGRPLLLFQHEWSPKMVLERNEGLVLKEFSVDK